MTDLHPLVATLEKRRAALAAALGAASAAVAHVAATLAEYEAELDKIKPKETS